MVLAQYVPFTPICQIAPVFTQRWMMSDRVLNVMPVDELKMFRQLRNTDNSRVN